MMKSEQEITIDELAKVQPEEQYPEGFNDMMREIEAARQSAILFGDEEWLRELDGPTDPNDPSYFV